MYVRCLFVNYLRRWNGDFDTLERYLVSLRQCLEGEAPVALFHEAFHVHQLRNHGGNGLMECGIVVVVVLGICPVVNLIVHAVFVQLPHDVLEDVEHAEVDLRHRALLSGIAEALEIEFLTLLEVTVVGTVHAREVWLLQIEDNRSVLAKSGPSEKATTSIGEYLVAVGLWGLAGTWRARLLLYLFADCFLFDFDAGRVLLWFCLRSTQSVLAGLRRRLWLEFDFAQLGIVGNFLLFAFVFEFPFWGGIAFLTFKRHCYNGFALCQNDYKRSQCAPIGIDYPRALEMVCRQFWR